MSLYRLIGACLAVTCCLSAPAGAQEVRPIPNQVRSTTRWGLDLLHEGREKSASFRQLLDALRETDLVVYVEPSRELPGVTEAVTELMTSTGNARYLRISVGVRAVRKRLIALLGHELQHALEIGRAREVVDRESLELFYRVHGDESVDGYDSEAARRMGEVILRELWGAPPPPRTPPPAAVVGTAGVTRN